MRRSCKHLLKSTCDILETMTAQITIVYEATGEGGFTAFIPEVPGAISEGRTREEAREMVLDALSELLAARREMALKGMPIQDTETMILSA